VPLQEPSAAANPDKHDQWTDDKRVDPATVSSARWAYVLFRQPVMVAVHADEMLAEDDSPVGDEANASTTARRHGSHTSPHPRGSVPSSPQDGTEPVRSALMTSSAVSAWRSRIRGRP
jgi:hypothetical protein